MDVPTEGAMDTINIGVAGLRFGRTWMNGFRNHPRCRLAGLCDLDADVLATAADEASPDRTMNQFEEMVADPGIDAVALFTPAPLHAEHSTALLNAGKHVLSAVPVAVTEAGCRDIVLAARASGRVYMMAENWPYEPSILKAHTLYGAGKLGKLYYGEAEYLHHTESLWFTPDGTSTWRRSFPPLLYPTHGLGPYLHMTGDRFTEVTAHAVSGETPPGADPERDWLQVAMLRSEQGCLFKLMNSFCNVHPGGHYLSFYGDRGSFETGRGKKARSEANFWQQGETPREMTREDCEYPPLPDYVQAMGSHAGPAIRIIDDFVRSVTGEIPVPIGPELSADMTLPGICAQESIRTGATVPIPNPRVW
jgi:predicted dehydrogenase